MRKIWKRTGRTAERDRVVRQSLERFGRNRQTVEAELESVSQSSVKSWRQVEPLEVAFSLSPALVPCSQIKIYAQDATAFTALRNTLLWWPESGRGSRSIRRLRAGGTVAESLTSRLSLIGGSFGTGRNPQSAVPRQ